MYYNLPFYSLIFIPVSLYQWDSIWNGVGIVVFKFIPSILPECVMASSYHFNIHRNAKWVMEYTR